MHFFIFEIGVRILQLHDICVKYGLPVFYLPDHMLTLLKFLVQLRVTIFDEISVDIPFK